jgi:hypothetical protein
MKDNMKPRAGFIGDYGVQIQAWMISYAFGFELGQVFLVLHRSTLYHVCVVHVVQHIFSCRYKEDTNATLAEVELGFSSIL